MGGCFTLEHPGNRSGRELGINLGQIVDTEALAKTLLHVELPLISISTAPSRFADRSSCLSRPSCALSTDTDLAYDGGFTGSLVCSYQRIVRHEYDHNIDADLRSWLHHEVFLVGRLADDSHAGGFLCIRALYLVRSSRD